MEEKEKNPKQVMTDNEPAPSPADAAGRSYIAFISYRHQPLDRVAAERVQKKIENYIVPKEFREQIGGKKLGLCFRDEDELPASSSLTDSIYYALDHSQFLIVICTPDLPQSKWCEAEIRYFLKTHDRDHVLAVLADGDPSESFSPYMLHDFDENGNIVKNREPLAANIAGPDHSIDNKAFKKEIVRLYAAMIGCPFDELWQRERRARMSRLLTAAVAAVAVLAVFSGVVLNRNAQIAAQNEQIQAQNEQITTQNDELVRKNDEIQKQNDQITEQMEQIQDQNAQIEDQNTKLQRQLSTVLVDSGINKLEAHDIKGSMSDIIASIENVDPADYDPRAEKVLADALGAYQEDIFQCSLVYQQPTDIFDFVVTDDERYALLLDSVGVIRGLDLSDYSVLWDIKTGDANTLLYTHLQEDHFLYKSEAGLYCHSVEDGSLLWSFEHENFEENYLQALSNDGAVFAVLDPTYLSYDQDWGPLYLVFLNTRTGQETGRVELPLGEYRMSFLNALLSNDYEYGASFSADDKIFVTAFPARSKDAESNDTTLFYQVDMTTFECSRIFEVSPDHDMIYGFDIDSADGSIFYSAFTLREGNLVTGLLTKGRGDSYDAVTEESTHWISSTGGVKLPDFKHISACDYLQSKSMVYIFSDNHLFIMKRADAHLRKMLALSGKIVNAYWLDRDQLLAEVICSDGYVIDYEFKEADSIYKTVYWSKINLANIKRAWPLNGSLIQEPRTGSLLAISEDFPGQLFLTKRISDPNNMVVDFKPEEYKSLNKILFSPDLNTGLYVYNGYNALTFDRRTYEVKKTAVFNDYIGDSYKNILLLDEDSFLIGNTIYKMNSTTSPYDNNFYSNLAKVRMPDDRILSWNNTYSGTELKDRTSPSLFTVWLDKTVVPGTDDPRTGLLFYNDHFENVPLIFCAASGLVMVYGQQVYPDQLVVEEERSFRFLDALTGEIFDMQNPYPDSGEFKTAFCAKEQKMAAAYEDGTVCIFDPAGNDIRLLEKKYSLGEIGALCFTDDDAWLLILTKNGELDVFDTASLEPVFESVVDLYAYVFAGQHREPRSLQAIYNKDRSRLYVLAGESLSNSPSGIVLDLSAWVLSAEIGDLYAYDPETDRIYRLPDSSNQEGSEFFVYPAYDLASLKAWAESLLD